MCRRKKKLFIHLFIFRKCKLFKIILSLNVFALYQDHFLFVSPALYACLSFSFILYASFLSILYASLSFSCFFFFFLLPSLSSALHSYITFFVCLSFSLSSVSYASLCLPPALYALIYSLFHPLSRLSFLFLSYFIFFAFFLCFCLSYALYDFSHLA